MGDPKVVVGIVTRDRAELLSKAIDSILRQDYSNLRIAVIDDGSSDETAILKERFPNVSWTRRDVPAGYMSARNELMGTSNGEYFVSLDDDAWFVGNDEIRKAIEFLESNRDVAAVAFDILSPDRPSPVARERAERAAVFIGCGHVLRVSAVRDVGMYEDAPGSYGGEEKDLCLRLMNAGFRIVRLPGVHVWHDKSPVARELALQHRSGVCNDLAMTLRRTPLWVLPIALPTKLYRHLVFGFRHSLFSPCLQGIWLFFRSIGPLLSSRRPVKASTLRNYVRLARS